jgi:hypothetical protein
MIAAIHQPNFLPWSGYFHKILCSGVFVFLDSVAFSKGSYTNRVKVKTAAGTQWLTVPVRTAGRLGQCVAEVECPCGVPWRKKTLHNLETNYRGCRHFQDYFPGLRDILLHPTDRLADLNIALIEHLSRCLGASPAFVRSSRLPVAGARTGLLVAICRAVGADTYLSGAGGATYQEEAEFRAAGMDLVYSDFRQPVYRQPYGEFAGGLSVLDLLFTGGPASREILLRAVPATAADQNSALQVARPLAA